MSRADDIDASRRSLRTLFPDTLDAEVEGLIDEIVQHCNPPIRVVSESTWALKAGGLVHCAVCDNVLGVRVELPRESGGRCPEHTEWKIFYRHHAWSTTELHQAVMHRLKEWLSDNRQMSSAATDRRI